MLEAPLDRDETRATTEKAMGASNSERSEERVQRLEVRVRRVLCGDGSATEQSTVYCPRRERSVNTDECDRCERGGGLHFDADERRTFVNCKQPAERGGAAVSDAMTPLEGMMSKEVVCVRPDASAAEITTLFLERGMSSVPVVDEAGRPVGVVSKTDLLRAVRDRGDSFEIDRAREEREGRAARLEGGFHMTEVAPWLARDLMTPVVLALNEGEPVGHAAALMAYEGVHHLPVVSDDGDVVGVLSSLDVLRWLGRRSGYVIPARALRR